ncbi:hypothetical protein BJ741DRAFT_715420 [Chytriomyces cf. hyalinus JEL632]|nr:hypothetical protein BJ741DRAFT_715420 [Chytriomyces cf. hyalinus JEL632]
MLPVEVLHRIVAFLSSANDVIRFGQAVRCLHEYSFALTHSGIEVSPKSAFWWQAVIGDYYIQMLLQLECTGLSECDFFDAHFVRYVQLQDWTDAAVEWEHASHHIFGLFVNTGSESEPEYQYPPVSVRKTSDFLRWHRDMHSNSTVVLYKLHEYHMSRITASPTCPNSPNFTNLWQPRMTDKDKAQGKAQTLNSKVVQVGVQRIPYSWTKASRFAAEVGVAFPIPKELAVIRINEKPEHPKDNPRCTTTYCFWHGKCHGPLCMTRGDIHREYPHFMYEKGNDVEPWGAAETHALVCRNIEVTMTVEERPKSTHPTLTTSEQPIAFYALVLGMGNAVPRSPVVPSSPWVARSPSVPNLFKIRPIETDNEWRERVEIENNQKIESVRAEFALHLQSVRGEFALGFQSVRCEVQSVRVEFVQIFEHLHNGMQYACDLATSAADLALKTRWEVSAMNKKFEDMYDKLMAENPLDVFDD